MVIVWRPGYRIDSRTIKGGLKWVVWSYHLSRAQTIASLHHLSWFLFVFYFEVLELVVIFFTSSSSSKTEFTCFFYCVFGVGVFTGLIRGRVLTFFLWALSNLLLIDISFKIVLSLVASFPTNLVSSNSELVCESCGCFDIACFT